MTEADFNPNCKIVQQKISVEYKPFNLFQEVIYADYDVCNEKIIQQYQRTEVNSMVFPIVLGCIIVLVLIFGYQKTNEK